jgi:hypothetical protein
MVPQGVHKMVRDATDRFTLLVGEPLNKVFYQQRDVVSPFAQGRERDRENV